MLVETDRILNLDIVLEVGANTETVTVSAAPPILDTQTGSTNSTVEGSLVDKLPALGVGPSRNSTKFALMQLPGSSSAANDTTRQTNRVMINGLRSTQLGWDEDGMPNRSASGGGNLHDASINNDSLKAIQYTLVNAGADSPTAARVSLVTKSGTNDFHGSAWFNTHNSFFDANSHNAPAGSKKPVNRDNYEGVNFAGPVYIPKLYNGRNRTFFLFTLELLRKPNHSLVFLTTPTQAMRSGDFSSYRNPAGQLLSIRDPLTGQPFGGNIIPANRIYAGAQNYLNQVYPLPNLSTAVLNNNAFGDFTPSYTAQNRMDIRFDQVINDRNNFFFRINRFENPPKNASTLFGSGVNTSLFIFHTYEVSYNATLRPNLLSESRFGMSDIPNTQRIGVEAKQLLGVLGVQGVPQSLYADGLTGVPAVTIGGITSSSQFSHLNSNNRVWNAFENVTWIRGSHAVKVGADLRKNSDWNLTWPKPGTFAFNGIFTGLGLTDFLLGLPTTSQRDYPRASLGSTSRTGWNFSLYAQDEFKISPRLTITYGLRWDVNLPVKETHGLYYNLDPVSGNLVMPDQAAVNAIVPTFPKTITSVAAGQANFPSELRNTDWNNLGPRIGIAWRLSKGTVLRTAYGLYYDTLSSGYLPVDGPWGGSETFTNSLVNGQPLWQFPAAFPVGVTGTAPGTVSISAVDTKIRNPYVQQWSLGVERQVGEMLLRAQYVGTKGAQLYWYPNLNVPPPSTIPFAATRRPYRQYGDITYRTNGGNSDYHGLTLSAERRLRSGITFNSSWTWSKLLTDSYDGGSEVNALTVGAWFPTFQRRQWRGNDIINPKHRWTTVAYAELPFGRSKKFGAHWNRAVDFFAGGWALTGYFNAETGWWVAPFYSGGSDSAGVNFTQGTPDRLANGLKSTSGLQPGSYFLDPTAFVIPRANIGRFGTAGLGYVQEPSWWRFDAGLEKTFPIRESFRFEFSFRMVDPLNHAYWGHQSLVPGLDLSKPATFGTMAGSYIGNRQIGFVGRFAW